MNTEDIFKQYKDAKLSEDQEERIIKKIRDAANPNRGNGRLTLFGKSLTSVVASVAGLAICGGLAAEIVNANKSSLNGTMGKDSKSALLQFKVPSNMSVLGQLTSRTGDFRVVSLQPRENNGVPAQAQEVVVLRRFNGKWYTSQTFKDQETDIENVYLNSVNKGSVNYVTISRNVPITSEIGGISVKSYVYKPSSTLGKLALSKTVVTGYIQPTQNDTLTIGPSTLGLNPPERLTFGLNGITEETSHLSLLSTINKTSDISVLQLPVQEAKVNSKFVVTINSYPTSLSLHRGETIALQEVGPNKVPLGVLMAPPTGDPGGFTKLVPSLYDNTLMLQITGQRGQAQLQIYTFPTYQGHNWEFAGGVQLIKIPVTIK